MVSPTKMSRLKVILTLAWVSTVCLNPPGAFGSPQEQATQILNDAGIKGGLIVHVGCGDGKLTAALYANDSYLVHGMDTDARNVEQAREHIRSLNLYGKVSVDHWSGRHLPYIDNLVNLVVSENIGDIPIEELVRVLVPEGAAYIKEGESWTKTVKPWPEEIDEWTHYLHDSSGNAVSHDSIVGPPRRFQWVGSPRWSRHHDRMASVSACVSANGRIFYIIDEGSRASIQLPSKWTLVARDAFNGTIMWKQPIGAWLTQYWPFKSGPAQLPRRLVAGADSVYVTLGMDGTSLSELDAATGQIIQTYDGTRMTEELVCSEGILFVVVKQNPPETGWNEYVPIHRAVGQAKTRVANEWPWDQADRRIMAIEVDTGEVLWQRDFPVVPLTLTAGSRCLFFHDGQRVVRLDPRTGESVWFSSPVPIKASMPANFGPTLVAYRDVVLFASGNSSRTLTALRVRTGQTLWTSSYEPSGHNCPHDLLVINGLAWAGATAGGGHSGIFTGWDVLTGQVKKQFPPDVQTYWFHHRCYRAKATERYLLPSRTGIEFIDVQAEHWTPHHWVRGGCLYGIIPCNGLVYTPPHNCACYGESKLSGFCALAPEYTDRSYPRIVPDEQRFQIGPAYGAGPSGSPGPQDWPTYRHDAARSGHTPSSVPHELSISWQSRLEGKLTSPVVANGSAYVASVDTHTLYALDEDDGQVQWSYTVGGRVDSPPTIYSSRVLLGSADGWVYCLRASDGALLWRFQAAPEDVRMTAFEQLESVWPVHGSVLVRDDSSRGPGQAVLDCVAGRSMFLDGGLRLLRLDPITGRKLSETILDDQDPQTGENLQVHVKGLNMPVALPDILSGDDQYTFMRSQRFTLETPGRSGPELVREQIPPHSANSDDQASEQYGDGAHLFSPFGFLDDTWFHRSYWVFGKSFASGAGGYYRAGRYAPAGRILTFDDSCVYGFGREPQYFKWTTPLEYHLFAADREPASDATSQAGSEDSIIRVDKSGSLNPAGTPLAVEAWVKADKADGVILARGAGSHGYALFVRGGRPQFAVRVDKQMHGVSASENVLGQWAHLAGVLTDAQELQIYVNGRLSATGEASGFISSDPGQAMQIGADEGGAVGDYTSPFAFTGIIDEVRIYHGTLSDREIRSHYSTPGRTSAGNAELVLSMSFDDGDATDDSGNGNHGEIEQAIPVEGKSGDAMRFVAGVKSWAGSRLQYRWSLSIPLFVRAMVLADETLFVAGPPDVLDEEEAFDNSADPAIVAKLQEQDAILDGQRDGLLWALSAMDGVRLAQYTVDFLPVFDGLIAANGRLYISTQDGRLLCMAEDP
ncbi:MAG: PQQ-binding-like beta-propeller repeat protein [Phycisphaerales bacterium]|nr:MAG: PQQ-binding-like beta-propeller repeat protein [Phycisphaerales bacterium]